MAGGYLASGLDPTFIIEVRLARLQHCELLACGWMAGRRLPGA